MNEIVTEKNVDTGVACLALQWQALQSYTFLKQFISDLLFAMPLIFREHLVVS